MANLNFSSKELKSICKATWQQLEAYGETWATKSGDQFIFQDNGADILMVAHTDTVNGYQHYHDLQIGKERNIICTALDDRLGVYTILKLLPPILGAKSYDILLTDGEERGHSTARYFDAPRQYNWIVEFDRHGQDVVLYQYEGNTDATRELRAAGFKIGIGSFSDIAELDDCNCTAFNVGVGFYDEHGIMAHMVVSEYLSQIGFFLKFWEAHKDTYFEYVPKVVKYPYTSSLLSRNLYDDGDQPAASYENYYRPKDKERGNSRNSLDPKNWNPWYDKDVNWGKCEMCGGADYAKKVSDVVMCRDCAAMFAQEAAENFGDDEWLECENCGVFTQAGDMNYVDLNDGFEEKLLCDHCSAQFVSSSHSVTPYVNYQLSLVGL